MRATARSATGVPKLGAREVRDAGRLRHPERLVVTKERLSPPGSADLSVWIVVAPTNDLGKSVAPPNRPRYEPHVQVERACLSSLEVARYVDPDASTDRGDLANHVDRCDPCRLVVAAAVRAARSTTKPAAAGDDAHPGDRVDRYAVFEPLGVGGMGVVYRAYDPRLDRKIALKLLRPGLCDDTNRERMQREAKMLAKLAHPHVVAVHDADVWRDRVYIAMELIDGVTLRDWLDQQPRSWQEIVDVLVQAGEGLASAHAAGVVHRDFKPHNVLIGRDGRARVSDFGLAGTPAEHGAVPDGMTDTISLTATGAVIGTPAYMSPEQLAGAAVDARSDQFSFCVTAYEALLGERPFAAASLAELRARFATGKLPEPPRNRVPRRVMTAVLRGLALDPADRFGGMHELVAALRRGRGRTSRATIAVAALAVLGAGGAFAYARTDNGPTPAERCSAGAAEARASLWNESRRSELARAFGAVGVGYARDIEQSTAERFSSFATEWEAAYVEACRATHVSASQTPAMLDLRVACLDDKRRRLDALVTRLSRVDAVQLGAVADAIAALPDVQACGDLDALAKSGPSPAHGAQAAEYDRLADALEEINVSRDLGDYKAALAQTERFEPQVDALGHKSLQAKYRSIRGELLHHLARDEEAIPQLEQALYLAEAARDQETKITALVRLYMIAGARGDKAAADRWSKLAEAAVDAGPTRPYARSYLLMSQGMYAYGIDDMTLAAKKFEESLAIARQDPESTLTLGLLQNLASVYFMQQRDPEAKKLWDEALAFAQRHYGPNHPSLAVILGNIGLFEINTGDPKGAVAHLQRALEIHVASLGAQHPIVGKTHLRLGDAFAQQGGPPEPAYRHYKAAVDNQAAAYPNGHPELTNALMVYAMFANEQKDFKTSLALYQRALASEHEADKADSPTIYKLVHGVGAEHLELGQHALAIPQLERALKLRLKAESAPAHSLAWIERDLGRAFAEIGKRDQARVFLKRAIATLSSAKGDYAAQLREIEQYLATL